MKKTKAVATRIQAVSPEFTSGTLRVFRASPRALRGTPPAPPSYPTGLGGGERIQQRKAVSKSGFPVFAAKIPVPINQALLDSAAAPIKVEPVRIGSSISMVRCAPVASAGVRCTYRSSQCREPETHRPGLGQTLQRRIGIGVIPSSRAAQSEGVRPGDATGSAKEAWVQRRSVQAAVSAPPIPACAMSLKPS